MQVRYTTKNTPCCKSEFKEIAHTVMLRSSLYCRYVCVDRRSTVAALSRVKHCLWQRGFMVMRLSGLY